MLKRALLERVLGSGSFVERPDYATQTRVAYSLPPEAVDARLEERLRILREPYELG